MEYLKYKVRLQHCETPCPHGMKATCHACKHDIPTLVAIGSGLERSCPFFVADDEKIRVVTCDYIPGFFNGQSFDAK